MISKFIGKVYEEDKVLYKAALTILKGHHVDEREIRDEALARGKISKKAPLSLKLL